MPWLVTGGGETEMNDEWRVVGERIWGHVMNRDAVGAYSQQSVRPQSGYDEEERLPISLEEAMGDEATSQRIRGTWEN